MKSDQEIINIARKRFEQFLTVSEWWRNNELQDGYAVYEGSGQWLQDDLDKQQADLMPVVTINKIAPIIDSVSGFEIQNRTEVEYVPRMTDEEQKGFTDMLNSTVDYIEQDSNVAHYNSLAFRDMLICGVGATNTNISYDFNPDGEVKVGRIFPGCVMWDAAARQKNLADRNWNAVAKIVDEDTLREELELGENDPLPVATGASDDKFLQYFNVSLKERRIAVIYEYEWREKRKIYRVANTLSQFQGDPELIQSYAKIAADEYKFDPQRDQVIWLERGQFSKLKKEFEALGLPVNYGRPSRYKYNRMVFVGDTKIERSENFSQAEFATQFMTGKYSESQQCFYGLLRAAKRAQRLLNQAVSDFQGYLRTIPKGGVNIEADAVPDLKGFKDTYTKAREVTVFSPGALMNGKVQPKQASQVPPGLLEMIQYASSALMEVVGVTPEFMGQMDSKDMTGVLQAQIVRQGLTVLAHYFDAKQFYMISQGRLFIDCARILAENVPGRLIRNVSGEGSAKFLPLLKNNIASEYDVIIEETPQTPSERQQTFQQLMELAGMLAPQGINAVPLAMPFAPLKKDQIDQVMKLMEPPPPPPPDPMATAMIQSQVTLNMANSEKTKEEAIEKRMNNLKTQKVLQTYDDEFAASQAETLSRVDLNRAKAHETRQGDSKHD